MNDNYCKFGELLSQPLKNGLNRPTKVRGNGYKMVNMGELFAHPRIGDVDMERVPLSDKDKESYLLERGDLLFARQSLVYEGAGRCAVFMGANEPVTYEGHIIRARMNSLLVDPYFYFYFFNSSMGRDYMSSIVYQVAAAGIRGSDLVNLEVPLPPLPVQREIAHILGSLDDKIELNRRMNATLEAMARALFRAWFIDFEPVRAKAAGRQPEGMDAETAALFPDSFEDSELGEIPAGWRVGTLGEEFNITMGQSPPGETYNEVGEGLPFYQGRRDFGFRFPTRRVYCTAPNRLANKGDTLLSVRAPVGDLNKALETSAIGRGIAALRHKSNSSSYTYYLMDSLRPALAQFNQEGTVFGAINTHDLSEMKIIVSIQGLMNRFVSIIDEFDEIIWNNEMQIISLSQVRDLLLPRLISIR